MQNFGQNGSLSPQQLLMKQFLQSKQPKQPDNPMNNIGQNQSYKQNVSLSKVQNMLKQLSQKQFFQQQQQKQVNLIESIIPISHEKRQRSQSPIKKQQSIHQQQYFSINSPKMNLNILSKFQFPNSKLDKSKKINQSNNDSAISKTKQVVHVFKANQFVQIKQQKLRIPSQYRNFQNKGPMQNSKVGYKSIYDINQKIFLSKTRSRGRRTQIFSSDKKHIDKSFNSPLNQFQKHQYQTSSHQEHEIQSKDKQLLAANKNKNTLTLNQNIIAEKILNLNKLQRQLQESKNKKSQIQPDDIQNSIINKSSPYFNTPSNKNRISSPRILFQLSQNKLRQIQKLSQIQNSPQRAQTLYWQNIYPQSKQYLTQLNEILSQEKQILKNWQNQLQLSLRENLYHVEDLILQRLYQVARSSVKIWIQQQMEEIQHFQNENFNELTVIKNQIQERQFELLQINNFLELLKQNSVTSITSQVKKVIEKSVFSGQYSSEVSQISKKVKQMISKSQQIAHQYCNKKVQKAISFESNQQNVIQQGLTKKISLALKQAFQNKVIKNINMQLQNSKISSSNLRIGQKIQLILKVQENKSIPVNDNQKSAIISQKTMKLSQKPGSSYSRQKSNNKSSIIKDNEKVFKQFKHEFENRRKKFLASNFPNQLTDENDFQRPVSQKFYYRQQNVDNKFDYQLENEINKKQNQYLGIKLHNNNQSSKQGHSISKKQKNMFRYSYH